MCGNGISNPFPQLHSLISVYKLSRIKYKKKIKNNLI
jgi:hypothetical protein